MMLTTKLTSIMKFKVPMYQKLPFLSNLSKFKADLIPEGIFNFVPLSKNLNQITVPHLFNLSEKAKGQLF